MRRAKQYCDYGSEQSYVEEINGLQDAITEAKNKAKDFNAREQVFGFPPTEYAELDVIELQPAPGPGPAEQASSRERAARLEHGLAELSAEDRDVVLQCSLAGESYADYGARRGLHPGAVKSRAFRARRRLEAYVEAEAGVEAR